jgi:protein-disulfide isomerase
MDSLEAKAILKRNIESGENLRLSGTPSFFLNGKPVKISSYDQIVAEISSLIN